MGRMSRLLDAFAEPQTTRKPLGLSIDGESVFLEEHAAISSFAELAYADGWTLPGFDWGSWDEGRTIAGDPGRIKKADLLTIQKLITALVRNERFCDGVLQSAYEQGVIDAILRRIDQLRVEAMEG